MKFFLAVCVFGSGLLNVIAVRYPEGEYNGPQHNKGGGRPGGVQQGGKVVTTYEVTIVKGQGGGVQGRPQPLFDTAKNIGLNKFCEYIEQAGMQDLLTQPGPYTIFAPSDEAFQRLPQDSFGPVSGNKEKLREVMQYHCIDGSFNANQLQTQSGSLLKTTGGGYGVRVEKYGDLVTLNGCPVRTYDQGATNGVIHVLDGVMYPLPTGNIGQTLQNMPNFEKLRGFMKGTNVMDEYLSGDKPYTFLAPSDDAFSKLEPSTLEYLQKNPNKFNELMQQHIIRGVYYTSCLSGGVQDLPTIGQGNYKLQKNQDRYLINNIAVQRPDISCTNGVIHVVDQVFIPQGFIPAGGIGDVRYPSDGELEKIRGDKGIYGPPGKPIGNLRPGGIGGPAGGSYGAGDKLPGGGGAPGGGKPYTGLGRPSGGVPYGPGPSGPGDRPGGPIGPRPDGLEFVGGGYGEGLPTSGGKPGKGLGKPPKGGALDDPDCDCADGKPGGQVAQVPDIVSSYK